MFIKHSFLKIKLFLKLGIFFNSHILAKRVINFNNYIFGLRSTRAILNINKSIFLLYRTLLLLQLLVINNGKILFIEKNRAVSSLITSKTNAINQFCISGDSWLPGSLTNYSVIRWNYILINKSFFYKTPQLIILLNFDNSSTLILNEVMTIGLPLITFCNFNLVNSKIISYPLIANFLFKLDMYFFFSEIFFFFIASFRTVNKVNTKLSYTWSKGNSNLKALVLKYLDTAALKPFKLQITPPAIVRSVKRKKKKKWKIQNKKKWFKHRLRKFKMYTIYRKKFIVCDYFAVKLKYNAQRAYLLKRIFFNFFDWQYNFYSMSRKVRRCSLFNKFRFNKKCKRIFTRFLYYISLFERQTIFVLKKIKFVKTIKQGVSGLLHKYFFVDNQVITNPQYLIGNNTIIQKKIYSSSLNTLLFFKQKKKLRLLVK